MKTRLFYLSAICLLFYFNLSAQSYSRFQLEAGVSVNSLHYGIFSELKYHYKSVDLGVRLARGVLGNKKYKGNARAGKYGSGSAMQTNRWSSRNAAELWFNFKPNRKYFKPVFGIGYAFEHFSYTKDLFYSRKIKDFDEYDNYWDDPQRGFYHGLIYKIGYINNDYRVYWIYRRLDKKDYPTESFTLNFAYNIGLSKKMASPDYEPYYKRSRNRGEVNFRLETGIVQVLPLNFKYSSFSRKAFFEMKMKINDKYTVGINYVRPGRSDAYDRIDKGTFEVMHTDSISRLITYSSVNKAVSSIAVFAEKNLIPSLNTGIFYGAGISVFFEGIEKGFHKKYSPLSKWVPDNSITGYGYYYYQFPEESVIKQNWNIGLNVRAGIRTGPFTNKVVLNIPIGEIPMTLEFQTAFGLNIRKRETSPKPDF